LVLLLGTVVGVGVYLINLSDSESAWHDEQLPVTTTVLTPAELRLVSLGEPMNINLALGPGGRNDNLVVEVVVGLNDTVDDDEIEAFYNTFTSRIAIARSTALDVFVTRTYDEVRTLEGRAETAEILKYALQEAFSSNLIVDVFFNEWTAVRGR
jgi:flagellar basal body-associated protein FliL